MSRLDTPDKPKRPPVAMAPCDSGWIDEAGYDTERKTMHLKIGDATYLFPNITPAKFASFEKAKSKGRWYSKHLREMPFKRLVTKKPKR